MRSLYQPSMYAKSDAYESPDLGGNRSNAARLQKNHQWNRKISNLQLNKSILKKILIHTIWLKLSRLYMDEMQMHVNTHMMEGGKQATEKVVIKFSLWMKC